MKTPDLVKISKSEKKSNSLISGRWKVINSTFLPFEHTSNCKKLKLNSIFELTTDGKLNVYESLNGKKCTKSQTYKIRGEKLQIREWDMIFNYEIISLSKDTLQFKIKRAPRYIWRESNFWEENIKKKLNEIRKNGILITLIKTKKDDQQKTEDEKTK